MLAALKSSLPTRHGLLASLAVCTLAVASTARASDAGPFSGLSGAWSGKGTVSMQDGTRERLRCRATYSTQPEGYGLNQVLRCASASYQFDIKSFVQASSGGELSGHWDELTRQVSGDLSGRVSPGLIQTAVAAIGFSAQLSVVTRGRHQSVSIVPTGTDVRQVDIKMKRL